MSDIKLSVGLETSVAGTGIQDDLNALLKNLEATKPKISIDVELSKNSLNTFQSQLAQIVKATSLGSGASININVEGLGKITSEMKEVTKEAAGAKKSLDDVAKSAKGIGGQSSTKQLVAGVTGYRTALQQALDVQKQISELQKIDVKTDDQGYLDAVNGLKEQETAANALVAKLKETKTVTAEAAQSFNQIAQAVDKYGDVIKDAEKAQKEYQRTETKRQTLLKQTAALITQLEKAEKNWTKAKSGQGSAEYDKIINYKNDLQALQVELRSTSADVDAASLKFKSINAEWGNSSRIIKGFGEDTKSLSHRIGDLAGKFTSWLGVSQVIMYAVNAAKKMVTTVIELDSAMTELKKVTDATDATYDRFLDKAADRAKSVGASITDVVTATADFARLGYNINDASVMADTAIVYKNVADGIENISEASASIISTMQAFGIATSDAMSIVDKFNNVSNNFAISSAGIGEAMQKSAAAMKAAGNDIDETIALITAANTVVQNPESVGRQNCLAA